MQAKLDRVSTQVDPTTNATLSTISTLPQPSPTVTNTAALSTTSQLGTQPLTTPAPQQSAALGSPTTHLAQPEPTLSQSQQDESIIFRVGEAVWYKNNNAWRLGIVLKTVAADIATGTPSKSLVKPLAHAFIQVDTVLKTEVDMRPFLTFSVPAGKSAIRKPFYYSTSFITNSPVF